jgi:prepilin signal peptidase PulO-like enzyme (type II secretory pathway)
MLSIPAIFAHMMPGMPPEAWALAPLILALLTVTAVTDARAGRVPDPIILAGLFFTLAAQGGFVGWPFAGRHLLIALVAGVLLYLVNEGWYRLKKSDAFGMGDSKWTVLAVACFGMAPAAIAWAVGAWLGLIWIGISRLLRRPVQRIHFAPFLFVGLLAGIYWVRLR